MLTYLARRLAGLAPVLLGITVVCFLILHLAPGSPTDALGELNPKMSREAVERMREFYGLDQPLHVQYWTWLKRALVFDFGRSFGGDHRMVIEKIMERLPITVLLNSLVLLISLPLTIAIGIFSARRRGQWSDRALAVFVFLGISAPSFWVAQLMMLGFAVRLGWLPISGLHSLGYESWPLWRQWLDFAHHLVIPLTVGLFGSLAGISRFMRSSMLEVLKQDYIQTARAKGLAERAVYYRHALRNSLLSLITILGWSIPGLLGGSVLIETVCNIPGLGRLFYEAVISRDYMLVMGELYIGAILTLGGNLVADIAYSFADPRIRLDSGSQRSAWLGEALLVGAGALLVLLAVNWGGSLLEGLRVMQSGLASTRWAPVIPALVLAGLLLWLMPKAWRLLEGHRMGRAGLVFVTVIGLAAMTAPWIARHDPTTLNVVRALEGPGPDFWLGTDELGRDLFARMLYGARISLLVGFVAVGISSLIGISLGAAAGYFRGAVEHFIMRLVDVMMCIPAFFLVLAVIAFVSPSIWNIMAVIGVTSWMGICRLVRAEFLSLREREFTQAAAALGVGQLKIMFRHILPNALAPVFVYAVLGIASAILVESGLSFLGLGVQPPTPSWGNILSGSRDKLEYAWWLSIFPGLAILTTVLSYNLLGEALRDALDPRLR